MSVLSAERIKLTSTRSPWWCAGLVLLLGVGLAGLIAGVSDDADNQISVGITQIGLLLGSFIVMVLAAIATTSDYRFGTIRTTFTAVPKRLPALAAKTVVVAGFAALLGLITAFAAWGTAYLIKGGSQLALDNAPAWRSVAGQALVYAGYAILAVGVGLLLRATAGAIAVLLVWALVVERIVTPIIDAVAKVEITRWLPFTNADNFLQAGDPNFSVENGATVSFPFGGPWGSLAYFLAVALVLLVAGFLVARRRDA